MKTTPLDLSSSSRPPWNCPRRIAACGKGVAQSIKSDRFMHAAPHFNPQNRKAKSSAACVIIVLFHYASCVGGWDSPFFQLARHVTSILTVFLVASGTVMALNHSHQIRDFLSSGNLMKGHVAKLYTPHVATPLLCSVIGAAVLTGYVQVTLERKYDFYG